MRRTKEENRLKSQAEIEHQNEMISIVSAWQDEGIKVEWKSHLKRIQESTIEEISLANKQLLKIRRESLQRLLKRDLDQYTLELSNKDLAFHCNLELK